MTERHKRLVDSIYDSHIVSYQGLLGVESGKKKGEGERDVRDIPTIKLVQTMAKGKNHERREQMALSLSLNSFPCNVL